MIANLWLRTVTGEPIRESKAPIHNHLWRCVIIAFRTKTRRSVRAITATRWRRYATPVAVGVLATGSVLAALLLPATSQASTTWPVLSPSNPDYPQRVDFVTSCLVSKAGNFDPIVAPGQYPFGHRHTFGGGTSINPASTAASLLAGGSNCKDHKDHAAYWMPTLYKTVGTSSQIVEPYEERAYYRATTFNGAALKPVPFGLRIIAGNSMATAPQSASVAGFQCRSLADGNVVSKQSLPPDCPKGTFLESSVVFPNCWDGTHLDSADHKSHMSYAKPTSACDAAHPVRLPALTFASRFPVDAFYGGKVMVAAMPGMMMSNMTLHADFINAWDPVEMAYMTRNCLNASVACADVTDNRRPPVA
jgi:hypothetical protein